MNDNRNITAQTKRVRILVAIDSDGKWVSAGYDYGHGSDPKDWIILDNLNESIAYRWIEAEVPMPSADLVVEGIVSND